MWGGGEYGEGWGRRIPPLLTAEGSLGRETPQCSMDCCAMKSFTLCEGINGCCNPTLRRPSEQLAVFRVFHIFFFFLFCCSSRASLTCSVLQDVLTRRPSAKYRPNLWSPAMKARPPLHLAYPVTKRRMSLWRTLKTFLFFYFQRVS